MKQEADQKRLPVCWIVCAAASIVFSSRAANAADGALCADAAELGQERRDAGKLIDARDRFIACASETCPAAVRKPCTEWLLEVDKRIPQVVVVARDAAGRDLLDVTVTLDRLPLFESPLRGNTVRVDPGIHQIRYEHPGSAAIDETIVLREGEGLRTLRVTFPVRADAISNADAKGPPTTTKARRPIPLASYVLGGVSLAAFASFGYFGLRALGQYRDLETSCAPRCSDGALGSLNTNSLVSDVSLAVGGLTLGAAAIVWLVSDSSSGRRASRIGLAF